MDLIKRVRPTSDVTSPWEGIAFNGGVDSDTLHEDLRRAYPRCSTRGERKLVATIEFFLAEYRHMKSTAQDYFTERYGLASPQSPEFSGGAIGSYSRQRSTSVSLSLVSSSGLSVPTERNMTRENLPTAPILSKLPDSPTAHVGKHLIFSAVDGHPVQPRRGKRKMTSAEKTAYKKTRIDGACQKCKKTKSKCTHGSERTKEHGGLVDEKDRLTSKTISVEDASGTHPSTSDHQQSQKPFVSLEPSTIKENANRTPDKQTTIISDERHWEDEVREENQSGTHGYVIAPEHPTETYVDPPPSHRTSGWDSFSLGGAFHTTYTGYPQDLDHSGGYPLESSRGDQAFDPNDFSTYS